MENGFWNQFAGPIVALSPMDGVTDAPWRFIANKYGQPDVVYTEFVSAEGLWRIKKRGEMTHKIWTELVYDEADRPVVAQIFGSDPNAFYEASKIVCELGFDGIDINMGCPSPGLEKRGGGAGLIRNPDLAKRVIEATRKGVADWKESMGVEKEIPVTLKTRIGSSKPEPEWWEFLASMKMPVVAMHGRTFKQLYSGEADWEILLMAAEVIKKSGAKFLGNGDIKEMKFDENSLALELVSGRRIGLKNEIDGVLIGRQAMGNPWVLRKDGYTPTIEEKLSVAVEHASKYEEVFKDQKFLSIRKHLAWYAHGFENASSLRRELVMCNSAKEVAEKCELFLKSNS